MTKILVIEDAEPLRRDIIEMLSFEGFDVQGAENGVTGIDVAYKYMPDLIICDIMMPELDGYGVLGALRKNELMATIPFIFLTAKTDRSDMRHGMGLGADDYLTKPFVASELLDTIHARLEKRKTLNLIADEKLKGLSESIITALPHELRTPLNTIIGFSDMLVTQADRLTPGQTAEWAQHINMAAQRLYRLVENYLTYVRAEVAMHNPDEIAVLRTKRLSHPGAIIEFQAIHKAQQAERKNDLELQLADDVGVCISDHDLGKIVEEVIDNALKFSNPGTPVALETVVEDTQYVIRVTDRGRGMSSKQVESIGAYMQFERYFYEQQGSGLGLAIAKRLAELYGGRLMVESAINEGAMVTVGLALA